MRALRLRITVVAALPLVLLAAPRALAGPTGHSPLVPLPAVSPPPPLGRTMTWAAGAAALPVKAFREGHATIGLAAGVDGPRLARSFGMHVVDWLPALRLVEVSGPPAGLAALNRKRDSRIRYVEPLVAGRLAHVRNDPLTYEIDPTTGVPYEWQFHAIGADQALNLAKGDPNLLVGVVDSGISSVPDLTGKIAETFWDKSGNRSAADVVGHGTFVSSLIASRNDDGFGLAGFCGACRLAVYKASPLTDVQVAEGIRTLTDAHVRIINLSIVLNSPSQAVTDALTYAANAGVLVVAATGNEGSSTIDFPASSIQQPDGAASPGLAVGASDRSGTRAIFSNSGSQLSLLAPGTFNTSCSEGILGAIPSVATDFEESGSCAVTLTQEGGARYAYAGGTSFAAPEVAGIAALVWSVKPSLTASQVAGILEQTATRPDGAGWTATAGWGVLNAKAALESATGRSSADSLVLSGLRIPRPRLPGTRIRASVKATWGDGSAVVVGARPSCRITVGGTVMHTSAALAAGSATCTFRLPKRSAGLPVAGTVTVSDTGVPAASATFRFAVARS
jgi:subtilisin family serine protease